MEGDFHGLHKMGASMNGTPLLRTAACIAFTIALCVPVVATAAPPVLTVPGAQTVNENVLLTFNVSASDPDGQTCDMLASSLPTGSTFRDNGNNTGTFSWTPTPSQVGTYVVSFAADDTFGGVDTETVSIEVRAVNAAPVLNPIADRSVERGGFLALLATGSDDDGDALSFRATGMPSFGTLTDNGDGRHGRGVRELPAHRHHVHGHLAAGPERDREPDRDGGKLLFDHGLGDGLGRRRPELDGFAPGVCGLHGDAERLRCIHR
jgi:Bacterial cadherin-like domain/Bacterial Ig domain